MKKTLVIFLFCILLTGCSVPNVQNTAEQEHENTVNIEAQNINDYLPWKLEIQETVLDRPLMIKSQILYNFIKAFEENEEITYHRNSHEKVLEGDLDEFVVATRFQVEVNPDKASVFSEMGELDLSEKARHITWKVHIKKVDEAKYSIVQIDEIDFKEAGFDKGDLPDVRYEIAYDTVRITYNNGDDWKLVPAPLKEFFRGEYNGSMEELIEGSYVITPEKTAFVIGDENEIRILLSEDQGNSWDEILIPTEFPGIRMRLIGFTSESEGYLILSGYRTMSQEGGMIFLTDDGGNSWYQAPSVPSSRLLYDGGFLNNEVGYMSYTSLGDQTQADFYQTRDGGATWSKVELNFPQGMSAHFTQAKAPMIEEGQLVLYVNQGPNGDYQGGHVQAKFRSEDEGVTWEFDEIVEPVIEFEG